MKKIIATLAIAMITNIAIGQIKVIYLNSKTTSCNEKNIGKQCLQYKQAESDTTWSIYTGTIKGFIYNLGYFYTLQVKLLKPQMKQWQLVKVISKTKSTQQQRPGDTTAMLSKPLPELVGTWNFTRLPAEAGGTMFIKEFLRFDAVEMRVTGKASCNSFFGNYTADTTSGKNEIHFEAIGHTMMACENLSTENKMLAAMEKITAWSREGNKLYLKAGNITLIELTRVAGSIM